MSFPLLGAYSASKHALEALSDTLRLELAGQGIHVSIIKPGAVKTNIWRAARASRAEIELGPEAQRLYGRLEQKVGGTRGLKVCVLLFQRQAGAVCWLRISDACAD